MDLQTPHIQQFSDGYRVWHPALGRYVGNGMAPLGDLAAASDRLREVLLASEGRVSLSARDRAAARAAAVGDLFGTPRPVAETQLDLFGARRNPSGLDPYIASRVEELRRTGAFTFEGNLGGAQGYWTVDAMVTLKPDGTLDVRLDDATKNDSRARGGGTSNLALLTREHPRAAHDFAQKYLSDFSFIVHAAKQPRVNPSAARRARPKPLPSSKRASRRPTTKAKRKVRRR